ncbi:MAG TPA: carboxyl transferase domain-containing protein [Bacteroidota bacterium]|nr:carboxyl transferase domain-containing protein [Bacteroidota bacterium]
MPQIGKPVHVDQLHHRNEESIRTLVRNLRTKGDIVKLGGGADAVEKHRKRGKMTARERITALIDPGTDFLEIGLFAAYGMYEEYGGAPSSGTVFGVGRVHGRDTVIVANDATVKAGAWFPITCKKNLRAQEIAMENRIPIVYLVDSAGVFLPLQSEIFPDKEHFGRIFRNNAVMSSLGIPQIAAIMGPCVAGGAYLPIMSDEALIVEKTGSVFLAGPYLVKAAIGEEADIETLGGAVMHSEISGVTDYRMPDDAACLKTIRSIIQKFGAAARAPFDRIAPVAPAFPAQELCQLMPVDRAKPYDMHQILARIIDGGEFDEYKAGYGKTLITGYARIDGWAVGIVANQRSVTKTKKGEMQVGGVIYSESADKGARFILNCNQKRIPLVFLQDVTGFMVGTRAEQGGIIKDGAKMVNAVANSVVPKITVIVGNSYGAGNYAMCGKAYDPRFIYAWPTAQIAVMGGKQASETLLSIRLQQMSAKGNQIPKEEQERMLNEIAGRYNAELDPLFAAARLWVDAIIDPAETRSVISRSLEIASNNPDLPRMNTGVLQV